MKRLRETLLSMLVALAVVGMAGCGGDEAAEDAAAPEAEQAEDAGDMADEEDSDMEDAESDEISDDDMSDEDGMTGEEDMDEDGEDETDMEDDMSDEEDTDDEAMDDDLSDAMGAMAKLNLNTATEDELATVPDAGERMVREFLEYRPYVSITQFRQEMSKYIDDAQIAAYEEHLFVPVSPDESDEATLMQLPGVDADIAAELAAGRPYGSDEAFLAALAELVGDEDAAAAAAYLAAP